MSPVISWKFYRLHLHLKLFLAVSNFYSTALYASKNFSKTPEALSRFRSFLFCTPIANNSFDKYTSTEGVKYVRLADRRTTGIYTHVERAKRRSKRYRTGQLLPTQHGCCAGPQRTNGSTAKKLRPPATTLCKTAEETNT